MSFFRPHSKKKTSRNLPNPTFGDALIPQPAPSVPIEPPTATPSVHTITTESQVNAISLTPDAYFFAVATNYCPLNSKNFPTVTIYEYGSPNPAIRTFVTTHKSSVRGVSLTPDASLLASCDQSGMLLINDATIGAVKTRLLGHRNQIEDVEIDYMGLHVVSGGYDTTVTLQLYLSAVCISGDANMIMSSGFDGEVRGWDTRTGKRVFVAKHSVLAVTDCACDPDARTFVSSGEDRKLLIWDFRKIDIIRSFEAGVRLYGCDIVPTASRVLASGDNGLIKVWDIASGIALSGLDRYHPRARVRRCAISGDGQQIIAGGTDNTAYLFHVPSISTDVTPIPHDSAPADVMSEIECEFCSYINSAVPLDPVAVVNAIERDFNNKGVSKMPTVYVGHICVRTLLTQRRNHLSCRSFSNDDINDTFDRNRRFFFEKLYHKMSELIRPQRCQEFAKRILDDAAAIGIISESDINIILGDALKHEYTRNLLSEMATVMNQVCKEVTHRIGTVESRLEFVTFDISSLRSNIDNIETKMERAAKVQRYANLVKFGLAMIPFVGSAAMAFTDGSVDLFLSLDLESVIEFLTGLISTTSQTIVDMNAGQDDVVDVVDAKEREDRQAVQVVQYVLSDGFLSKMEARDKQDLISGLERQFGGSVESLRQEVKKILDEHEEMENTENIDGKVECVRLIESANILVEKFRKGAGERKKISHRKACALLKEFVESVVGVLEDLDIIISDTLFEETDDEIYFLIDETCFVRCGKKIVSRIGDQGEERWGKEFDKATAGDTEISTTVAIKMMGRLMLENGGEQAAEQQIETLFGTRDDLTRDQFVRVARTCTDPTS